MSELQPSRHEEQPNYFAPLAAFSRQYKTYAVFTCLQGTVRKAGWRRQIVSFFIEATRQTRQAHGLYLQICSMRRSWVGKSLLT